MLQATATVTGNTRGVETSSPRFLKVQGLGHLVLRLPPLTTPLHKKKAREAGEVVLPSRQDLGLCLSAVTGLAHSLPYLPF